MKRHALLNHLRRHGYALGREGSRHTIFSDPASGAKAALPRRGEIDNRLTRKIC